ncbi:hypothetical protein KWH04_19125 [Xanthomonas campestris pv. trichodesmae]|uniref:DUF3885 domain-containing protein n=1 Tax=Xanthomonas citri pv. vignicola TaxID=473426 RepID=A0AB33CNT6_XANCI|nr:hypothetical protein [Xanthomonas citri]ASK92546.1 hypothetical protein XcvCFBP7111P_14540 [Xanthomonas citri pv. vignicola]MBV6782710.1 hypothetical protein [Xanthomonas campestris pv. trichodesmae]
MKNLSGRSDRPWELMGVFKDEFILEFNGGIYSDVDGICDKYNFLHERDGAGYRNVDYSGLLLNGKSWIIEPLRLLQPNSYQAFQEAAEPLLLGVMLIEDLRNPGGPPMVRPILFLEVHGRMVEVFATFPSSTYEDGNDCFGSLLSLPDGLAKSWLWRTDGWRIPGSVGEGPMTNRQLIGHPSSRWRDADTYLDSLGKGWKKKYLPKIKELFPDAVTNINGVKRIKFRCFLDTRPVGVGGPEGDQFFVCSTRQDQVVYHVHEGNVENLRVLRNPEDAIDRYCAHVLRRKPGQFDFSDWSEPFRP